MTARCSICQTKHDRLRPNGRPQSYCQSCHASWMRKNRPKHSELSTEARLKANCRAHANVAQQRGQIKPKPCTECGAKKAEKHHVDYTKPLEVVWMCRPCHLALHNDHHERPAQRRAA